MSVRRPFRDLCPEADERDAMDDDTFWVHVLGTVADEDCPDIPELDVAIADVPCPVCGEVGACAYDSEGRPLIHASDEGDQ